MTKPQSVEEQIIDLGVEVDTHRDGDAFVTTYTFNNAQLQAFVADREVEIRKDERRKTVETVSTLAESGFSAAQIVSKLSTKE